MTTIRVALCDDVKYLIEGYKAILENDEQIIFVGEAYDSQGCIYMVQKTTPDILLLDIQMDGEKAGVDIIPTLKEICPRLKIIMLTSYSNEEYVFSAFANGADDYFVKSTSNEDLIKTIKNVFMNISSLRPEIAQILTKKTKEVDEQQKSLLFMLNSISKLSTSEFQLLRALYYGDSYKKIAADRFVEVNTIRKMASRIIQKFEVNSMNEILSHMKKLNVFDLLDKK